MHILNKEHLIEQNREIESEIKKYEYELDNLKVKSKFIKQQIADIEKREMERPKNYEKIISTLINLPEVREKDLKYQANRFNIDLKQLKKWIWMDGYHDEIYS